MLAVHGHWEIKVTNNVLMQKMYDSWNEEGIVAYIREFKLAAKPLIGENWAIVSIFEDWELAVPEVENHIRELSAWFIENGCTRDCHVYTPSALKSAQLEKAIPVAQDVYQRRVFADYEQALSWLNEESFTIVDDGFLAK
jgi:hypothetical protein